ncbi:MAG: hypothetical protein ACJ76F_14465 [Bacteroidia bacterium]
MKASELIQPVQDIAVAIVPEETDGESTWMVYLVNLKNDELSNVLITANGYGELNEKPIKTSTLRYFIEAVPPHAYSVIEPIMKDVFGLNNEYWVSFYIGGNIYDKKFVFLPESILESNFVTIPLLNKKGVMIR